MAVSATEKPVFLLKKLGGVLLLLCGILLTVLGYSDGSTGLTGLGVLVAMAGVSLLVLKIVRRNHDVDV